MASIYAARLLLPTPHELLLFLPAQLITAATGRPRVMRNLAPEAPPRPRFDIAALEPDYPEEKEEASSSTSNSRQLCTIQSW